MGLEVGTEEVGRDVGTDDVGSAVGSVVGFPFGDVVGWVEG